MSSSIQKTGTAYILFDYIPPERIKVKVADPTWALRNIEVGDWITVNDPDAGLSGKYRVYSKELTFENGLSELELELGTGTQEITTEIKKATDTAVKLSQYMQGATNIFVVNETENAQSGKPIDIFFHIPEDAVAINSVKLSYRNEPPRIWSDVTLSGGSSTTSAGGGTVTSTSSGGGATTSSGGGTVTTTSVTTPNHTHDVYIGSHSHSVSGTTSSRSGTSGISWGFGVTKEYISSSRLDGNWHDVTFGQTTSNYPQDFVIVTYNFNFAWYGLTTSYNPEVSVRIYNQTDGVYFPNSNGYTHVLNVGFSESAGSYEVNGTIVIPKNWQYKTIILQYKVSNYPTSYDGYAHWVSYRYYGVAGHTHTISGQTAESENLGTKTSESGGGSHSHSVSIPDHTHTVPDHTHDVTIPDHTHTVPNHTHTLAYQIATKTYTTSDISIYTTNDASVSSPTWTNRTSAVESALGRSLKAGNGEVEEGIDLTQFFSGTGWKGIRIATNGNSRHKAQVVVKCYVQSKT